MAKTKAQLITLLQELARNLDSIDAYLSGTFTTNYNSISTAIAAGDDEVEDEEMMRALRGLKTLADNLSIGAKELFATTVPSLGRYAGLSDLTSTPNSLAAFFQKLDDDSEAFLRRGFTKFTSLSTSGNTGDGLFIVGSDDINGDPIDCSHVETITLECDKDATFDSGIEGEELFRVYGARPQANSYEDYGNSEGGAGSGDRGNESDYRKVPTGRVGDWPKNARIVRAGRQIKSYHGQAAENLILNGGFEATLISGETTGKIENWTIASGDTDVDVDATAFVGAQALEISGDMNMAQSLESRVKTKVPLFVSVAARKVGTVSGGTLTIKIKDDSTTHATVSITLSGLGTSFALETPVQFILPAGLGDNLEVEIEVTSWAGTGDVLIDELVLGEMAIYDTGYYFAIVRGAAAWRQLDKATGQTTSTDAGKISRAFNRVLGVAPKAAASAADWDDYS